MVCSSIENVVVCDLLDEIVLHKLFSLLGHRSFNRKRKQIAVIKIVIKCISMYQ